MDTLEKAASLADLGEKVGGVAARLFQTLKGTSCSSGYSTESAKFYRRQHWALCDYYGLPALFFDITPCDECTFRVCLCIDADTPHFLRKLYDGPFDKEVMESCIADFKLQAGQHITYPGACSLVYTSMLQIVVKCLLSWSTDNQVGQEGDFGILEAWARTDKEQGRKHHMVIGLHGYSI